MATPRAQTPPKRRASALPTAKDTAGEALTRGDRRYKTLEMTLKRNQYSQDALIEVLHKAQETFGYLEEDVLTYIARGLKLPLSRVYGVATFYHLFSLKPAGMHTCIVCLGTACYVKGSGKILETLEQELGVTVGNTSADGKVSLLSARCVGACGIAPVAVFDGTVAGKVEPAAALSRIQDWETEDLSHG